MQVKKQQLKLDIEQWTGLKLGKKYVKGVLSPCLFNLHAEYIIWNEDWMKHKLELGSPGEIPITSDMQMKHLYGRKWRGLKEPLDESERGRVKKLA